jgi:hypothetical protein
MTTISRPVRALLWLAAVWVATATLWAQGLAGDISSVSTGAPLDQPGNLLGGAQIQAAKDNSSVSIRLSRVRSMHARPPSADREQEAVFETWSLTASAPLNKTADETSVATLDGLANSACVELGFTQFFAMGKLSAGFVVSKIRELDAICTRVLVARKVKDGTPLPAGTEQCDSELVEKYGTSEDKHAYESLFWDLRNSNRWLWGGSAKLGYQEFSFVTATATSAQKSSETPWAAGLWGAVQPQGKPFLITLSAQYQRSFKEGDTAAMCPVAGPAGTSTICVSGPLDAPRRITKRLVTAEARWRFSGVGLALAVTRDLEADVTGVELPIYLVADKDGKLTAGLKAGWRSDTQRGSLALFVGKPFGFYK